MFVLLGTSAVALASFSASASEALAEKYGCAACHQVAQKVVGPSWKDVQGKYAGKLTPAQLAASVKAGSSGKWGAIPMPPQAAVPDQDLVALATWILEATK
jgi:cytochrome c